MCVPCAYQRIQVQCTTSTLYVCYVCSLFLSLRSVCFCRLEGDVFEANESEVSHFMNY